MSSSALIKILSSRRDQSSYRATVDKLGLVVCSSPDLQTIIDLAASELGRALDEPPCASVFARPIWR
jgi:hypothetical protein